MREHGFSARVPSLWQALESMSPWGMTKTYQLVEKDKNESILYVNAPGYTQNDLSVEMNAGVLSVSGSLSEDRHKTDITAPIDLQFTVSKDFRVEDASLEHGLLAVRLVRQHKAEPVKIQIR